MKVIRIDNRLKSIADLVDNCERLADVGTDHGYLPIYLIQTKKVAQAFACDVAIEPLNSAKNNIITYNLQDKIQTILTNGLKTVPKCNYVVMAGMGANLIIDILSANKVNHDIFILQPNLNVPILRQYLSDNNYCIIDEEICFCKNKYYEILKVKKGFEKLTSLQIQYGPINLKKRDELFLNKYSLILNKYQQILEDFKGSLNERKKIEDLVVQLEIIIKGNY